MLDLPDAPFAEPMEDEELGEPGKHKNRNANTYQVYHQFLPLASSEVEDC